jgi:hypothetical protein
VFAALGPELLDEGEQRAFRRTLDAWLANRFRGEAADVIGEILDDGETASDIDLSILDESFGTLVVQLRALGLITHSERRRSVSDKGTYWALTPYGDGHLTTLRAIRRQSSPAAQEGSPRPRDEGDDQDEDDEAVNGFESETADEERDTTGG